MSTPRCDDWRDIPKDRLVPLYHEEVARWASVLEWDAAGIFAQVELGRRFGHVRGVVAFDDAGTIVGWSFYIVDGHTLQIGGFISGSEECSEALLSAIFDGERSSGVTAATFFAYSDAPGLAAALRRRGQTVDRYFYLARDLVPAFRYPLRDARRWRATDMMAAADLMKRAYPEPDEVRPFAPGGERSEWINYVRQLTSGGGCGDLIEESSVSVPLGPDRLSGVALVSRISPSTAHLVQLAIDPSMHGRGLGSALLLAACGAAHRCGLRRMTILVSGKNAIARRLYETAGFEARSSFIAAGSSQPLRLSSVAGSGVAASRR